MMKLTKEKVFPIIIGALKEDIGSGDITSSVIFEKDINLLAHIATKEECVLAGMDIARWVFNAVDEKIVFIPLCKDGDRVKKNKRILSARGPAKSILSAERTVLNFLGHLSGVATLTNTFVKEVKGTSAKIYDTRKTMPGLRELEKYAVSAGGGFSYRIGLWDGVLAKDNHIDCLRSPLDFVPRQARDFVPRQARDFARGRQLTGNRLQSIKDIIKVFKNRGYKNIEIEVDNLEEFKEALDAGADIIMLDNMKPEEIRKAVKLSKDSGIILEASGGITIDNVKKIAKTGVDRISIGRLTHSAPSIDFSLEI